MQFVWLLVRGYASRKATAEIMLWGLPTVSSRSVRWWQCPWSGAVAQFWASTGSCSQGEILKPN